MHFPIADRRYTIRHNAVRLTLALSLSLCAIAFAAAVDLPTLQQGQWDFKRSVLIVGQKEPAVQSVQKCIDPTEDIRAKWDALARQTCKFSPVRHTGNKYQYSAICTKNGASTRVLSAITVNGETAYEVVTQSVSGERRSIESLSAHRIGDCAPQPTATPAQPLAQ